jgi:ADP-ribosyl-[dinitrogen reductase] hydrolase
MSNKDRVLGALAGLAVGDALGVPVEFNPRGRFTPVTGLRASAARGTQAGEWSDDTSMALCLAESLLADDLDVRSQMEHYCRWLYQNEWTATGRVFDVGVRTREVLSAYHATGKLDYRGGEGKAGNGSIMRLAPVPMFCHAQPQRIAEVYAEASSMTTHQDERCLSAARWMAAWMWRAMHGASLPELAAAGDLGVHGLAGDVARVAAGSYLHMPREQVKSSGYVIDTLEAALWCIAQHDNFHDTVLEAVNLGDDSDTVGAVAGQMAGALYGLSGIPPEWVHGLARSEEILGLAEQLYEAGG